MIPPSEVRIQVGGSEYVWRQGDEPHHLLCCIDYLTRYLNSDSVATVALISAKPIKTDNETFTMEQPK